MASPTNTRACTFVAWVSRLAWAMTLPIWVWPPRQSMPRHQLGEPLGLRHPARGPAFVQAAVVDELDVEPADRRRLAEHVGLQPAGGIPGRLPAHGGVEREDQPAALPGAVDGARPFTWARKASISGRVEAGAGARRLASSRRSIGGPSGRSLAMAQALRWAPIAPPIKWP